jgi:hypothetical protein
MPKLPPKEQEEQEKESWTDKIYRDYKLHCPQLDIMEKEMKAFFAGKDIQAVPLLEREKLYLVSKKVVKDYGVGKEYVVLKYPDGSIPYGVVTDMMSAIRLRSAIREFVDRSKYGNIPEAQMRKSVDILRKNLITKYNFNL